MQEFVLNWSSRCLVARMLATFQVQLFSCSYSVIKNGTNNPIGVQTLPQDPLRMYRSEQVTLRTVGPHHRLLVVSVSKSQALSGDALSSRSTITCDEYLFETDPLHDLNSDGSMFLQTIIPAPVKHMSDDRGQDATTTGDLTQNDYSSSKEISKSGR